MSLGEYSPARRSAICFAPGLDPNQLDRFRCRWEGCTYTGTFSRETTLLRHIRSMHISPAKFPCSFPKCRRTFGRKDQFRAHMRSVHPGEIHESIECQKHESGSSENSSQKAQANAKTPSPEYITSNAEGISQEAQRHGFFDTTSTINPSKIVPGNPKTL
jgi:hypothetical protein